MKKLVMLVSVLTAFAFSMGFNPLNTYAQAHNGQLLANSEMKSPKLSEEKAKEIALKQVKGQGEVVHSELESDDGRQVYDFKIKASNGYYEVEVDANTGKVLEVEKEDNHEGQTEDDDSYDD